MKPNGNPNTRRRGLLYARLSERGEDDPSIERQISMVLAEFKKRGIACNGQADGPTPEVFCEGLGHHSGRFTGNRFAYRKFVEALENRPDVGYVGFTGQDRALTYLVIRVRILLELSS